MPRRPRPLAAGLTYHLTARGNERRAIFVDDRDRRRFLGLLGEVAGSLDWLAESYCLMPNHVHVIVRTPEPDLSDGMHDILGRYARGFNDRYGRVGHLFEKRFDSRVVADDAYHREVLRYVALNPVRAKLCARAGEYPWSAHGALAGTAPAPSWLDRSLAAFDGDAER